MRAGKKLKQENPVPAYGKHLIIDAYDIKASRLKNYKSVKGLLSFLPGYFGMKPLGRPVLKKVKSPDYPEWGLSGFVMLYESHISVHTWPETGYVSMDVYSCKEFNHERVITYLKKYWHCGKISLKIVKRKNFLG